MTIHVHVCTYVCLVSHTTLVTVSTSTPHLAHLLRKRVLCLSKIVHISNLRVLPTARELVD